jgi:type II restriction enzyme
MPVNSNKPLQWKTDIAQSVDMYNDWFMEFAPTAFRNTRIQTTKDVEAALFAASYLTKINPAIFRNTPDILPTLRMSTCPPLAVDRLIGLAGVPAGMVKRIENEKKLPARMAAADVDRELAKIGAIIGKMADPDIFVWLGTEKTPTETEIHRAATIVADRLCGSVANPIIRNAQEKRQLAAIKTWLEARGYTQLPPGDGTRFDAMQPGTFSFRMNVPVKLENKVRSVNIPIDVVIMPKNAKARQLPMFFKIQSVDGFGKTNKYRKFNSAIMAQMHIIFGKRIQFNLLLCGYFDSSYLGYEAAEGIDWVWEHRMDDLALFGI